MAGSHIVNNDDIQNASQAVNKKKIKLRSKIFLLFWLVLFVFFISLSVRNSVQLHEIDLIKSSLQSEIDDYKAKYLELDRNRNYYDSDAYVEKVAREQLGLLKPDEVLYYNDAN